MKTKSHHWLTALAAAFLSLAVPSAGHAQARYPGSFGVVDIIPGNYSGETAGNAEPSIGVGSGNYSGQIVVHAFGGNPIYTSSDYGFHWSLLQYVTDGDATIDWSSVGSSSSPVAYIAMLLHGYGPISVWSTLAPASSKLAFSPLKTLSGMEDQPWLRVVNVNGSDHIYVCSADVGSDPASRVYFSLDGGGTWKGPITVDTLHGKPWKMRLDFSPDGDTVYVLFARTMGGAGNGDLNADIVLQRDDNSGLDSFNDLPNHGTVVAHNVVIPFGTQLGGQKIYGNPYAVASHPLRPNRVFTAIGEVNASGQPVIEVRYSQDSGQTFPYLLYSTDLSLVDGAGLPTMAVTSDGTMGLLYLAQKGNNIQIRLFKANEIDPFTGKFKAGTTSDRVLATFPFNQPLQNGNPWVGDYFQIKAVGNDLYGVFSASNDPQPSHFPSGVYYQRNVRVNGLTFNNFWLFSPGILTDSDGNNSVTNSMDPFFFYSVGGTQVKLFTNEVHLKTFGTIYPPPKFVEGPVPVPPEGYTDLTNNPPLLNANGEFVLPFDQSRPKQFFRVKQEVTNATFQIFASADGNGNLNPMGIVMVAGTSNQTFTATASNNYAIGNWHLDGTVVQTGGSTLTISNIIADHSLMVTFPASNDLAVTIYPLSGDPENPVFVGSNLTYVAEVMNDGLNPLTDVTISNLFDPTVTYISSTASQGSVAYAGGSLTGNLGGLAPGATATVKILVQPGSCGSVADMVSAVCDQFEPNLANNTAMDISTIWGGDQGIVSQPQSQVVDAGATVSFSMGAEGCPAVFTYQWNFNELPIFGATNATLWLTNVTGAAAGQYDAWVYQTAGGVEDWQQVESDPVTLTVIASPAAPYVVTGVASPVNYTTAGLNGSILPNGLDTTYSFQWGLTTSYGQSTVPSFVYGSNNAPVNVQGGATGLAYGTTYHFQLFSSNVDGASSGGDQTFTTPIPPPAAIVATFAPSNITSTSALLQGTINGEGSTWIGFFEWGTSTSYGHTTANFYYPGTSGPYAMYPESMAISGLSPNTTYHYRIDAYNGNPAEAVGNDVTFSTSGAVTQSPPTATTIAASTVNASGATLNGTVNPNGADTHSYYQYGTTTGYGTTTAGVSDVGTGNSAVSLPYAIGSLSPNTLYHYQIVAYNSGGTSYGADMTFTTGAAVQAPPTVQTMAASSVTSSSAIMNGTVNPNGAESHSYFEYGTTTGYGTITALSDDSSGSSTITLQYAIGNLLPNTTYHCQIVGYNSGGTNYGGDITFTTAAGHTLPAVQTLAASSITASSAELNGLVNPNGADTHTYFQWGTTSSYGNKAGGPDAGSGSVSENQVVALNGLSPNTTYHYQIVAYNSGGTNYGAGVIFTSLPLPPSVTTQPASNNGGNGTLTFNASVNPKGGQTYVVFQYGRTTSFELGTTQSVLIGSGTTAQPATATVSVNNTAVNYYFRAVASNPGGETYGATLSIYGGAPQ